VSGTTSLRFAVAPLILALILPGCESDSDRESKIRLATTTSTANSGLLDHLLPEFEKDTGIHVDFIPVGTGRALKYGRDGEVDLVLVHAPPAEEEFVSEGFGVERIPMMWNDFVLLGPKGDPARLGRAADVADALRRIESTGSTFVSRGDDSGTHRKERVLWKQSGVEPLGGWYTEVGQGMGPCLLMATEKQAYVLADRGTFLAMRDGLDLAIAFEGDPELQNPYALIAVNPAKHAGIRHSGAETLIRWMTSPRGRALIAEFRVGGEPLFRLFDEDA